MYSVQVLRHSSTTITSPHMTMMMMLVVGNCGRIQKKKKKENERIPVFVCKVLQQYYIHACVMCICVYMYVCLLSTHVLFTEVSESQCFVKVKGKGRMWE